MKLLLTFVLLGIWAGSALAQQPAVQRETQHRFGLLATRAVANFRSADSIEANLRERGQTLNPQLVALRLRILGALDEARADIGQSDFVAANDALDRAQGFLDRFAQSLGGF